MAAISLAYGVAVTNGSAEGSLHVIVAARRNVAASINGEGEENQRSSSSNVA